MRMLHVVKVLGATSLLVLAACSSGVARSGVAVVASAVPKSPPLATPAPATTTTRRQAATLAPSLRLQPIIVNTVPENGKTFEDILPFQTTANDPAVGANSGDGIANVTFQFFGPDGNEIFTHVESTSLYCAFGGGDNGQACTIWRFSEHKNQWPNGKLAHSGAHRLVVTIRSTHGAITRVQRKTGLILK